jgi:hypothetical protein
MILFDKINFDTEDEFLQYSDHMDASMAVINLVSAALFAQKKGIFNLQESELLSKSVRVIGKVNEIKNEIKQ